MNDQSPEILSNIEVINQITAVPSILEVICNTTGMGFAAIARVTSDKWIACAVRDEIQFGLLPGGELKLETTICHEIRQNQQAVIIDHVAEDGQYATHHTPEMYGFQSYISVPIFLKNGSFFGTLCAIDPKPAQLKNKETLGMFQLFTELIAFHYQAIEELVLSEKKLAKEQETAKMRDQFIAMLGHDLRNPLGATLTGAQLLMLQSKDENVIKLASIIKDSSLRISGLVDNILDFASGQLGEGLIINKSKEEPIVPALEQVITELETTWPGREIITQFAVEHAVNSDTKRIAQLLSNLLSNAITYGDSSHPVTVNATTTANLFTLSVTNAGLPIPPEKLEQLFQPFFRGTVNPGQQGLGLGLYICAEIAKAHKGSLEAQSDASKTVFTFTMEID